MKSFESQIHPDLEALSQATAAYFASLANYSLKSGQSFYIAISGGNTPRRLYQILAQDPYRSENFWFKTHVFWCDERCVPPDHPESNFGAAYRLLLSEVGVPSNHLHRMRGEWEPSQAVSDYTRQLKEHAALGFAWPRFDLVLLGLGTDGHTASLFPGSDPQAGENSPVLAVASSSATVRRDRITLTQQVFNSARQVVFLISGADKSQALANTLSTPVDPVRWPAQRIHPPDGKLLWMIDAAAGRFIEPDPHQASQVSADKTDFPKS